MVFITGKRALLIRGKAGHSPIGKAGHSPINTIASTKNAVNPDYSGLHGVFRSIHKS